MERPSWGGETGPEAALLPGTRRLDPRVVTMLRDMQIPIVRFPGGSDVDYMDWRDMVTDAHGEGAGRPVSRKNDGASVTNNFGYDEYLRLAEELGWKTILVVNLRDGLAGLKTPAAAAEHAAALLAYCAGTESTVPETLRKWPRLRAANGHPAPCAVEYLQIGNETFFIGGWSGEIMKQKHGDNWVTNWADTVQAYVNAMRAVLPDVKIIVDQIPLEIPDELQRRKVKVDAYAFHNYFPCSVNAILDADGKAADLNSVSPKDMWDALVHCAETDEEGVASWHYPQLLRAREMGYRIAMTEWNLNGWMADLGAGKTLWPRLGACGLGAAVMLHNIIRAGDTFDIATQSMLVGQAWGINGIRVTPDGGIPPRYHPSAQVTTLYNLHHGDSRLAVRYAPGAPQWQSTVRFRATPPSAKAMLVDVLATRDDAAVYLHILNTDYEETHRLEVRLDGFGALSGEVDLHRLRFHTSDEQAASNAWATEQTEKAQVRGSVMTVVLPPRSATVAVLKLPLPEGTGILSPAATQQRVHIKPVQRGQ